MRIHVVAFATASQALGATEHECTVPEGARLGEAIDDLARAVPALAPLLPRLALAVDGELADRSRPLTEGCEVALLPPVSGG